MTSSWLQSSRIFKIDKQYNVLGIPVVMTQKTERGALGWTNGTLIFVSLPAIQEIEKKLSMTEKQSKMILNSVACHETGHVLLTNFTLWGLFHDVIKAEYPDSWSLIGFLANLLEDIRIEFYMSVEYPGLAPMFRQTTRLLSQIPHPATDKSFLSDLITVLLMTMRYGLWDGDFVKAAREISINHREYINEVLNLDGLMLITEAVRGRDSRSAVLGSLMFYERALQIAERFYTQETIETALKQWITKIVLIIERGVMDEFREMLPPDAYAELERMLQDLLGRGRNIQSSESKSAGKGGLDIIVDAEDFVFYNDTINQYRDEIRSLRNKFERISKEWTQDKRRWGSPIEEELIQAYMWSQTKDIPAPRIFEGYRKRKPPMDIVILLDQSGSMEGEQGALVMRAAVIIAETLAPILGDEISLAIYAYGNNIREIKAPWSPINQGRFFPRPGGGTSVFASIDSLVQRLESHFDKRKRKIITVFSDSYNSDNARGPDTILVAKNRLSPLLISAFSTTLEPDPEFVSMFDMHETLHSVEELPEVFTKFIHNLVENLSRVATT